MLSIATLLIYVLFMLLATAAILDGLLKAVSIRSHNELLQDIVNNKFTKKQLIDIARMLNIKYSGLNKNALRNQIIYTYI